ncbi:MAG: UDP-N-acetyl-D-mannosaminuronic acid dehydrogenase [Candidatus Hecatellales archaeon B24]|nr:MAG: UDP-N-acetyl-D-mannosaminuronic acid dehydrogenase [Candidatus Hecatellales archaeon B24]
MNFMRLSLREAEGKLKNGEVKVCLWGLGRVGLTVACLLADAGVNVLALDPNPKLGSLVASGEAPYQEPGLEKLLRKALTKKKLSKPLNLKKAASESQIVVSTVSAKISSAGSPDYAAIEKFCSEAGLGVNRGSLIVFTGTLTPGITEELAKPLLEERSGLKAGEDFGLAYGPVKASAGSVIAELTGKPMLLAGLDRRSFEKAEALFRFFAKGGIFRVNGIRAAEAAGLFQEISQDVNLALANEFARFCGKAKVSFREAARALSKLSTLNLQPGIACGEEPALASKLLVDEGERVKVEAKLVKAARRVNEETLSYVVKNISRLMKERGKTLSGARVILLGVSSRADVKEDRASPARLLAAALKRKGAKVKAWDPLYPLDEVRSLGYEPAVLWEALPKADCVIVTVGHQAFKKLKTRIISELSAKGGGILFDCSEAGVFAGTSSEKVTVSGLGF